MSIVTTVKKSLRAKFTIVLFIVGLVPIVLSGLFFYHAAKDALFKNVFKELKWTIGEVTRQVEAHFTDTGKDLLIASKNTAFTMYFREPGRRDYWASEQERTLKHLRGIYPDIIDEACYIEASGREVSRIVFDRVTPRDELSSSEERTSFFSRSFELEDGEVFQGRPTISEDTRRWVIPNSTPITIGGKKVAILHFEVNMGHFQRLLKRAINPDRGYGFIVNDSGEFMANTLMEIGESAPFPKAITETTPEGLRKIYRKMMAGESGIEEFSLNGSVFYAIFRPVETGYIRGRNDNRWSIAYVLPGDKVYVELSFLKHEIIAVVLATALILFLAYSVGNYFTRPIRELAGATHSVAAGEMPKLELNRSDEIGDLSVSFNLMVEALKKRDAELRELARTDGLTGLYNDRFLKTEADREVKSALRFSRPLSLIMADVDAFKTYNEVNGHLQGDAALVRVAELMRQSCRDVDMVARYGGEEYAVLLRECGLEAAVKVAERIRKKIESEVFPNEEMQPGGEFTISIGVAEADREVGTGEELIEVAERALYRAKKMGGNRISIGKKEV
ncbi:MAG TPA: diguanylate cyclase [Thermodesulfobacteriota bacterium]|nr:diguanylate cyclase [Thermodesulfobacteriota bacterium]